MDVAIYVRGEYDSYGLMKFSMSCKDFGEEREASTSLT